MAIENTSAPAATIAPSNGPPSGAPPGMQDLTQIGGQGGSNPGGLYQDVNTGIKWYIKEPKSAEHAKNEVVAAKLYEAAGIEVPEIHYSDADGTPRVFSKIVDGMSEGTRDQLYLALRLAGLEMHLAEHEPMPMILDDLLVHFDDTRARHALAALGRLAGKSQVLLFTHHAHLVELARQELGAKGFHLHEL